MNTHGNVVFNSEAYRRWMDLTPDDCVLGIAPLFHITGIVAHLTVALLVPMPLVLGFRFDPGNMLDLIERWQPTFTVGAITAFIALMNDPSWDGRDLSSLTKVYSGGAPIAPATVERFQREAGAYIHNIYGLTETTSPSHGVPMGGHAPTDPKSGALSVGVPIFNTVVQRRRRGGQRRRAGRARRVRHQRTAGRGRLLEQAGGDRARPARAPPAHRRHRLHGPGGLVLRRRPQEGHDHRLAATRCGRGRSRASCTSTRRCARRPSSASPTSTAARRSRRSSACAPARRRREADLIAFCKERMAAYKYPRSIEFVDELPKTVTGKILHRELRAGRTGSA